MNRSRLIFFFAVLAVVLGIARCNSKKTALTQAAKPAATPAPALNPSLLIPPPMRSPVVSPASTPVLAQNSTSSALKKTADRIVPSVVALSVFDGPGRLLRNGTGFFISPEGRLATSRSVVNEGAHAVAKTTDGKIYNVTGVLIEDAASDIAILKTEVKGTVPFVATDKAGVLDPAKPVGIVGSPVDRRGDSLAVSSLGDRRSTTSGEWNELSASLAPDSLGSPVINDLGEILGIVTLERGQGNALTVVRTANAITPLASHLEKHARAAWAVASPPDIPAEGPSPKPKVAPPPVTYPPGTKKLVYAPRPRYPNEARRTPFQSRGSGRYRISFGRDGAVHSVQVVESTRSQILDSAAVQTLRTWKAAPGTDWTAEVPLSFSP